MQIPDCYDPVIQEDARQADWDKFVESLPVCGCCGKIVYPHSKYFELRTIKATIIVCKKCKSDLDESETYLDG